MLDDYIMFMSSPSPATTLSFLPLPRPELPLGLGSFHLFLKISSFSRVPHEFQCEFMSGKTLHAAGVCKCYISYWMKQDSKS